MQLAALALAETSGVVSLDSIAAAPASADAPPPGELTRAHAVELLDCLGTRRASVPSEWQGLAAEELERKVAQALDPQNAGLVSSSGVLDLIPK